jgi:hypothetical protein
MDDVTDNLIRQNVGTIRIDVFYKNKHCTQKVMLNYGVQFPGLVQIR